MSIGLRASALLIAASATVPSMSAQPAPPPPVGGPDEEVLLTIHLTPGMARGIARHLARDLVIKRYGLPEEQTDEVAETIARRMMQTFHELDSEQSRAAVEQVFSSVLETIIESNENRGRHRGMPPELGMTVGRNIGPMVPAFRDLVRNVGQDIRPMLPMRQQLKLAADLLAVKTGLDSLEQVLQRWSAGDVRPFEDPFNPDRNKVTLDEQGQSRQLKEARLARAAAVKKMTGSVRSKWEEYLKEATEFYGFDESQVATAESILREMLVRLETVSQDEIWNERYHQNDLWRRLLGRFNRRWDEDQPIHYLVMRQYEGLLDPIVVLGDEFKDRIDRIPRDEQRRAARRRIEAALAEKGIVLDGPEEVGDGQ